MPKGKLTKKADWDPFAKHYDTLFAERAMDIPFWINLANKYGSTILELASGTGRIAIPIARSGINVVGIDISKNMLREARKKIAKEQVSVQKRIKLYYMDVNNIHLGQAKFSAIFSTWGFIPITAGEQASFFNGIKRHLDKSGVFVIDIFNFTKPTESSVSFYLKEYKQIPGTSNTLMRWVYQKTDHQEKINTFTYLLEVLNGRGSLKKFTTQRTEKIYTKDDMLNLLNKHGFKAINIFGDYDSSPWKKDAKRTIIVAKNKTKKIFFF